jgi:O-antigen chain-terminating bifunctional methyltransferase/kinase
MAGEMQSMSSLVEAIGRLPEIYQQIFGHPELSGQASRSSDDRLAHVVDAYTALSGLLGRDLRVLDLGCAQGFFCHHLAARGAIVHGVDFIEENIAICSLLAQEHPGHRVTFGVTTIEQALAALRTDEYDLVLGLSVFHHLVCSAGASTVREMIGDLGRKVAVAIFEMALREEPVHWANAQPNSPRELLENFDFVHELARIGTHLSTVARPLYVASNRYWFLSGCIEPFSLSKESSHGAEQGIYQGTRRYYINSRHIAKLYRLENAGLREANIDAIQGEVGFLSNVPATMTAPALISHGSNEREIWLVREYVAGELLYDLIVKKSPFDAPAVLRDILSDLVLLEDAGLYHSDVRAWNVVVDRGRSTLIDFGAISTSAQDCAWPHDVFLSFLIFVREVLGGELGRVTPTRSAWFDVDALPEPYRGAFWSLLRSPPQGWSFRQLHRSIEEPGDAPELSFKDSAGVAKLLKAAEDSSRAHGHALTLHEAELAAKRDEVGGRISALEREVRLRREQGESLTALEEQRNAAQDEVLLRRRQVNELGQGLEQLRVENRRMEEEIALRRQQVNELGQGLEQLRVENRRVEEELVLRRQQVNDLGQGLEQVRGQNATAQEEISLRRRQVEDLGNALRLAAEHRAGLERAMGEHDEHIDRFETALRETREHAAELSVQAERAERELVAIRASRSFRMTRPLRVLAAVMRKLR